MITKLKSTDFSSSTIAAITGPTITSVQIASDVTYATILDDTAVSTAGGYIIVNGTGFVSGCQVYIDSTISTSVSFVSSTRINVQVPAASSGTYVIYLLNPDGSMAIRINGITYSTFTAWSTGSNLPDTQAPTVSISLSATSDSSIIYSLEGGSSLPPGITLSSSGLLSGTWTGSSTTTYNFTVVATDVELQNTSRTFSVTIILGDTYFPYTTLLLSASDTTNTWTQDASTNKFAVTVVGDTRPNAFSPYRAMWSNFFNVAEINNLTTAVTGFDLSTGNWTVEAWVYITASIGQTILNLCTAPNNNSGLNFWINSSNQLVQDNGLVGTTAAGTIALNTWTHVAAVRTAGATQLYVNGVAVGSTISQAPGSAQYVYIGRSSSNGYPQSFAGYISNVRVVKGTAIYTGNFTPSTAPLTAVTNTQLLTCQSNRFVDNSPNAIILSTVVGTSLTTSSFSPFVETDLITGSGYFDGSGDYLSMPSASSPIANENFTIECWYYPIAKLVNYPTIYSNYLTYSASSIYISDRHDASSTKFSTQCGGVTLTSTTSVVNNTWYHIAVTRNSGTLRLFINGVLEATGAGANSSNTPDASFIGRSDNASIAITYINAYVSNFRIVRGTAVYTAAFTPPTSSLTAITNTQLLTLQYRLGENNSRFIDQSGLNHVVTRNGNATQGTFTPFSQTGWSNYLNGSTDYITSSHPDMNATWTIEAWIYRNFGNTEQCIALMNNANFSGIFIFIHSSNYIEVNNGVNAVGAFTNVSVPINVWTHVAIVRSGGTTTGYINGAVAGTNTFTPSTVSAVKIGHYYIPAMYFPGYISNFRVVNGTAVYTSAFTPPTSPLTAITNTSLLTCQSNRFLDNSSNAYAITLTGTPSVQAFSPFAVTAAYSTTTVGGSAYFDGSGDNLSVLSNAAFNFGSGAFTVEAWVYPSVLSGDISAIGWHTDDTSGGWALGFDGTTVRAWVNIGGGGANWQQVRGGTISLNTWSHIALVRDGSNFKIAVNGTLGSAYTNSGAISNSANSNLVIGGRYNGTGNLYTGYVGDLRITKGAALYTAAFTPPTAPPTVTTNTTLLLNFTNAGIKDSSSKNALETAGNASITNVQSKFNVGSIYFDGTDDYLLIPPTLNLEFGSANFTIEFWWYPTSTTRQALYHGSFGTDWSIGIDYSSISTNQKIGIWASSNGTSWNLINADGGGNGIGTTTVTQNAWNHIAYVRNGTTWMLFVNGNRDLNLTGISGSIVNRSTSSKVIGTWFNTTALSEVFGYIDDFRITKGIARYTTGFTVPTSAFLTR